MASSGKITAHNLHLLAEDDAPDGKESVMPDDDLNLRTATADSHSSADSRKMDESPVEDDPGEPTASLTDEAKYQQELKERVKKSFADLGIEPEGVLLKDSLEETPRDSLDIKEDLPYDGNIEQGEYDARKKKQVQPGEDNNDDNLDEEEEEEDGGDGEDEDDGQEPSLSEGGKENNQEDAIDNERISKDGTPVDHEDNILADSLDVADAVDDHHHEDPPESATDTNQNLYATNGDVSSTHEPSEQNEEEEEANNFRDSLDDFAEPELEDLNESNPLAGEKDDPNFGKVSDDDEESSTAHTTPNNDTPGGKQDEASVSEQSSPQNEVHPHLSNPAELDKSRTSTASHKAEDENADDHDQDEAHVSEEGLPFEKENSLVADENGDEQNERTFNEYDDDVENNEDNGSRTPAAPEREPAVDGSVAMPDEPIATPDEPIATRASSGKSQKSSLESRGKSRGSSHPSPANDFNMNNNGRGSSGKPPSGSNSRNSSRQRNQSARDIRSPHVQTPVRSRPTSRERDMSSRSRAQSRDREASPASRQQSYARNGSSRPRSSSADRTDSRLHQGSQDSSRRGSQEGQMSRRGSREITIPRYSRRGSNPTENESIGNKNGINKESVSGFRLQNVPSSSKSERILPGSAKAQIRNPASEPDISASALKPATGPVQQIQTLTNGNDSASTMHADPRDFATPGQQQEAEANKKFWSDLHQAGVFDQPAKQAKQVEKLRTGEKVRVEYISDDSGDEDLHFVDEKGSPIDQLGRPLYPLESPKTPSVADLRITYKIKPSPPKQKPNRKTSGGRQQSRDVSAANSSRYSSGKYSRNGTGNSYANEMSRIPVRQLVDRQVSPIEDEVLQKDTPQQGVLDSTVPPLPFEKQSTFVKERPVKSACLQTEDDLYPSDEVKEPESMKSPVQEAAIQTTERETAIQTSDEPVTGAYDNTLPYRSPHQSPRGPPGSGPFGQVRVGPYQQSPSFEPPSPFSNQPNQFQYQGDGYAQQLPMNYASNPQAHWQPNYGPPGYPQRGQPFAAPLQPQFVNPVLSQGMNQQVPHHMMQPHPGPMQHQAPAFQQPMVHPPQMQPPQASFHPQMHPSGGMPYPFQQEQHGSYSNQGRHYAGQEMEQPLPDEHSEYYPAQVERQPPSVEKKFPPKPRQNFIDINKTSAKLRRDPPNKKYTEALHQKKGVRSPLNPKHPLPQISRENSQDDGQTSSTGWTPHGSATSRSNDLWAQQVHHEQQMLLFARGMSDPNIHAPPQMPPALQRYGSGGYPAPDTHLPAVSGQPYSWSADRANAYARMNAVNQAQQNGQPTFDPRGSFDDYTTSPRQRMAYTHPMPKRTSPFQVLPDIHDRRSAEDPELRTSDPDGYAVRMHKKKQAPQYKPYTMKDFQSLKKDFKLGGLGPDKSTISERQDKAARQREYAKQVMQQNKKVFRQSPTAGMSPQNMPKDSEKEASRRDMALEYAKKIPKPRVPTPPEVLHDRLYGSGANSRQSSGGGGSRSSGVVEAESTAAAAAHRENIAVEMARLDELTVRHKQEREQLDKLRSKDP